jgi:curved DNA-binding protein CbpA
MPNHYERLGVPADASTQQLRQAFRTLSKRYHPDTTSLPAAEAEAAFQQLRQAYGVLGDPASRSAYDERLRQPARPAVVFTPPANPAGAAFGPKPTSVRRSLSGGEWFALVLLALALALSLVLGVGLAWARGAELMTKPSWWVEPTTAPVLSSPPSALPESSKASADRQAAERSTAISAERVLALSQAP